MFEALETSDDTQRKDTPSKGKYKIERQPRSRRIVFCESFFIIFRYICVAREVKCRMAGRSCASIAMRLAGFRRRVSYRLGGGPPKNHRRSCKKDSRRSRAGKGKPVGTGAIDAFRDLPGTLWRPWLSALELGDHEFRRARR